MGVYLEMHEPQYSLAVWRTDESPDSIFESTTLPPALLSEARTRFKSEHRQLEWLSVRALFLAMTGEYIPIKYHPSGKPYVDGGYISISHTSGFVAVAYSTTCEVALDIESYGERVCRVAKRFMATDEHPSEYDGTQTWSLLLHWSGKETIYKMVGEKCVDFRESIHISPFAVSPSGCFTALAADESIAVNYLLNPSFVLTWSVR